MKLPEGVTPEMMKEWKAEHGHVGVLQLPNNKAAVVKRPCRTTIGEFEKLQDSSPNGARNVLIENSVLWGKEEVMADDLLYFSCARGLINMMPVAKSEFIAF